MVKPTDQETAVIENIVFTHRSQEEASLHTGSRMVSTRLSQEGKTKVGKRLYCGFRGEGINNPGYGG